MCRGNAIELSLRMEITCLLLLLFADGNVHEVRRRVGLIGRRRVCFVSSLEQNIETNGKHTLPKTTRKSVKEAFSK